MTQERSHGVHPRDQYNHLRASGIQSPDWRVPDTMPVCNRSEGRCEIWAPSAAFGLPTEHEKVMAAKQHGQQVGEEGWQYVRGESAAKPGWIVIRRPKPADALAAM